MILFKIIFFVSAASQIASTFLTPFTGGNKFNELLITPAGYTFSIWGIITLFTTLFAFWHLFFDKHNFSKRFYVLQSLVYICFSLWLMAAVKDLLLITLIIFVVMYVLLLLVFNEGRARFTNNSWYRIFFQGGICTYLAWSSIAVIINLGVYVFSFGIQTVSKTGIYFQIAILALAVLSAGLAVKRAQFNLVVFITHWWALVGVLVGLLSKKDTLLLLISTLVLVAFYNIYYLRNLNALKKNDSTK